MAKIDIIEANIAHADYIAEHLRDEDVFELQASGSSPHKALTDGLRRSVWAKTVIVDDKPCLMFGVAPLSALTGMGTPWLLGTAAICKIRRTFIRQCRGYVDDMLRSFPVLVNYVDERNTTSIRWLKWLGFELQPAVPAGVNGEMFHRFEMREASV